MAWSGSSRHERGYGTAWDKLRKIILKRDRGLCQSCMRHGRVKAGGQVDHIQPKAQGGTDVESNLETICQTCHDAKTARETGRKLKKSIGTDGWPIS